MRYALDPITRRPISPETHAVRKSRHGMNAICGACKAEVFDHSVDSLKMMPHFNHRMGSGPCPLRTASPEKDTADYSGDGKRLRQMFFHPESVQFAFAVCQALVCGSLQGERFVKGNFMTGHFIELLRVADSRKKWYLKGYTPRTIPFALVANAVFDLKLSKSPNAKTSLFTFCFDKVSEPKTRRRQGRALAVDPREPIRLTKHFMDKDGTVGSVVGKLAPGNPFVVSEESAIELAGPNWNRLPIQEAQRIIRGFSGRGSAP